MAARTTAQRLDAMEARQERILAILEQIVRHFEPADPDADLLGALRAWKAHQSFTARAVVDAAKRAEHQALRDALEIRGISTASQLTWRLKAYTGRLDTGLVADGESRDGQLYRFACVNFGRVVTDVA